MNYWIIADTHFGHKKITECFGRPEGFEEKIFKNLNVVQPKDTLIHLGDFCMSRDKYWHIGFITAAPYGKHWLIKGNHDSKSYKWYLEKGWDFVAEQVLINMYGKRILFSHHPQPEGDYDINIHGHLHANEQHHHPELNTVIGPHNHLIAMEHEYKPVTLRSIVEGRL